MAETLTYANMGHIRGNKYLIYEYLNGDIIAEYHGYMKPKRGCLLLYPEKIRWNSKKSYIYKKEISEHDVRVNVQRSY